MKRGEPIVFRTARRPSKKAAQAALLMAHLRAQSGPRRLGGRMRTLQAAGDPFRLRLPKLHLNLKRMLTPPKAIRKGFGNVIKTLAPIAAGVLTGGASAAVGALANLLPGQGGAPAGPSPAEAPAAATLVGPGAPSQSYHDQVDPRLFQDMPVSQYPVSTYQAPEMEVTPDDSDQGQAVGGLTDDEVQQLRDAGVDDDTIDAINASMQ
jgi:hypothetical protein